MFSKNKYIKPVVRAWKPGACVVTIDNPRGNAITSKLHSCVEGTHRGPRRIFRDRQEVGIWGLPEAEKGGLCSAHVHTIAVSMK